MRGTGDFSIVDQVKNTIHKGLQIGNVLHTEEVEWVHVHPLEIYYSTLTDVEPHCYDIRLQCGVLVNQCFHLLLRIEAAILTTIGEEDDLSWLIEGPAVWGRKDVVCQALDSLSCGGQVCVVPSSSDPVVDFLPILSFIHTPQTGGAQLKFNMGAECNHANANVPTEQLAECTQDLQNPPIVIPYAS